MASVAAAKLSHLLPSASPPSRPQPLPGRNPRAVVSFSSSIRAPSTTSLVSAKSGVPRSLSVAAAAAAANRHVMGSLTETKGLRFAVVVARFNEVITNLLLEGALETFRRYSVKEEDVEVIKVPGSFEIPVVAQALGKSGDFHAIICIGAVIRGDTTHYEAVANSASSGVLSSGLSSGVPCIFGVLTCETMEQALDRAGGKAGNKGAEAALTAIEMASLFEHHLKKK